MELKRFEKEFKEKVCDKINLVPEGMDRFLIRTPFTFDDGDHLKIVLKKAGKNTWQLSDEGHTFMHLSYEDIDLDTKTRRQRIDKSIAISNMENRDGELVHSIENEGYGDALYSFIQGVLHISDVTYLKRERVRNKDGKALHNAKA